MTRTVNPKVGGIAAIVGGVCWVIKAAVILATGDQPPVVFEIAPLFFAVGVIGLYRSLQERSALAHVGAILAAVGVAATIGSLIEAGAGSQEAEEFSALILVSFLATFVALLLVGIPTMRQRSLRPKWHILPVVLFAALIPLMVIGGALEAINERLLELPILVLGAGWVLLGYALARRNSGHAAPS